MKQWKIIVHDMQTLCEHIFNYFFIFGLEHSTWDWPYGNLIQLQVVKHRNQLV
jgi:hypothetical protein